MKGRDWRDRLAQLDRDAYRSVAKTDTPGLDRWVRGLSQAANYSKLNLGAAGLLATLGGPKGRRAALLGLASVAVTATVVNVLIKPLGRRSRPDRGGVALRRHVRMPISRSFPSGHTAAAFAFATGAGQELPSSRPPLLALAALVGYSRVHTGVHYPSDVIVGALCGVALAEATGRAVRRRARSHPGRSGAPRPAARPESLSAARSG
jgi:membrane-associated phospholipid phosphatase